MFPLANPCRRSPLTPKTMLQINGGIGRPPPCSPVRSTSRLDNCLLAFDPAYADSDPDKPDRQPCSSPDVVRLRAFCSTCSRRSRTARRSCNSALGATVAVGREMVRFTHGTVRCSPCDNGPPMILAFVSVTSFLAGAVTSDRVQMGGCSTAVQGPILPYLSCCGLHDFKFYRVVSRLVRLCSAEQPRLRATQRPPAPDELDAPLPSILHTLMTPLRSALTMQLENGVSTMPKQQIES